MKCLHKNLGRVEITEACEFMQKTNPDPYSVFVLHNGEIIEVSSSMVYLPYLYSVIRAQKAKLFDEFMNVCTKSNPLRLMNNISEIYQKGLANQTPR